MSKDPAFLFYSSDFLTGVADLTMEERGQYITLLCLQHQKGHLSEKTIRLALGYDLVNQMGDVLQKFCIDEDGCYYNERLDIEVCKRALVAETRRTVGKLGGRPKNQMANQMETKRLSKTKAKENLTEDVNEDTNKGGMGEKTKLALFDVFYKLYPRREAKVQAQKSWLKLDMTQELFDTIMAKLRMFMDTEQWTKDKGKFVPLPATWINNRRWEDEIGGAAKEKEFDWL